MWLSFEWSFYDFWTIVANMIGMLKIVGLGQGTALFLYLFGHCLRKDNDMLCEVWLEN